MKYGARTIFALLLAGWASTTALAAGPSYRLEVAGLACPICVYRIERKLSALDGVEHLETNIEEGAVIVMMKEGANLDAATASQAVKDAGFTLIGFDQLSGDGSR